MKLVRERRLAYGWSQEALAQRVRCTKQHISLLELGKTLPSIAVLRRLAAVLQVSDAELLADIQADIAARSAQNADCPEEVAP